MGNLVPTPSLRQLGEPAGEFSGGPGPRGEEEIAGPGLALSTVPPELHQAVCLIPLVTRPRLLCLHVSQMGPLCFALLFGVQAPLSLHFSYKADSILTLFSFN